MPRIVLSAGYFTATTNITLIGKMPTPKPDTHETAKPTEITVVSMIPFGNG